MSGSGRAVKMSSEPARHQGVRRVPEEGARPAWHQGVRRVPEEGAQPTAVRWAPADSVEMCLEEEALRSELSLRLCSLPVCYGRRLGLVSQLCSLRSPGAGVVFPGCLVTSSSPKSQKLFVWPGRYDG